MNKWNTKKKKRKEKKLLKVALKKNYLLMFGISILFFLLFLAFGEGVGSLSG